MSEEKETTEKTDGKTKTETDTTQSEDAGSKEEQAIVKEAKSVAETQKEAEELKAKNLEKEEKLLDRKEALNALGGGSPAGTKPDKPEKLTDTEYAEALERGEVNPLKEDGLI